MKNDTLSREARVRGGLYGLLVGDALGVPYEFHDAEDIPPARDIEMTPPKGFRRAHSGVPAGTWSDDGAQALCLLDSLVKHRALDLADFAAQLRAWYGKGHMTPDGRVFDVGIQTSRALSALAGGASPQEAGPAGERDNGNGALMRVLPVVWMARSLDEAIDLAMRQGLVTHGHIRSQLCCALYAIVGLRMLEGMNAHDSLEFAQNALRERFAKSAHAREAQGVLDGRLEAPRGSGYVVDSLWSALDCVLETSDYETCVRRAVMLGNDTDTTACIAGGLAGLLYGYDAIPARWIDELKGRDIVERVLSSRG